MDCGATKAGREAAGPVTTTASGITKFIAVANTRSSSWQQDIEQLVKPAPLWWSQLA
jgi:hypothetical protein